MNVSGLHKYDPTQIEKVIRKDKGLYIWWSRETSKAVYVGRALNQNGLRGRVLRQHLNPKYLENRPDKTCNAKRTVVLNGKKVCENSVFRKAISEKYNLNPGVECVNYIMKNFLVSFIPMPTSSMEEVKQKEELLIKDLKPDFNKQYQYHEQLITRLIEGGDYKPILKEGRLRKQRAAEQVAKQLRQKIEQARRAHAEREEQAAELERLVRRWEKQEPPKKLIKAWFDSCAVHKIDPKPRLDYLCRPLKDRLTELFYKRVQDWEEDSETFQVEDRDEVPEPPGERIIHSFCNWDVFSDPTREPPGAELVTYLEDVQEEFWHHQPARRSPWRAGEWKVATTLVDLLRTVFREVKLYIMKLTGDEPECDPRIEAVWPLLRKAEQRLRGINVDCPRPEGKGRPMVGKEKDWPAEVQGEVFQLLVRIRPWRKNKDDWPEGEHKRNLKVLSERIVEALGLRATRGLGSGQRQRQRPPSNP